MDSQTIEKDGAAAKSASSTPPSKRPLAPTPLDVWLDKTRKLLAREKDEEIAVMQQELDALDDLQNPNVLVNLKLAQYSTGLFGRTVVKLAFPSAHVQRAKPHQFTVGDLVQLRIARPSASSSSVKSSSASGAKYPTGIVARVEETALSITLSESDDVDEDELLAKAVTIDRLVNNATFVKLSSALDRLAKFDYGAAQSVVEIVFSGKSPSWNPLPEITPFNPGMNESQLEAIRFALASKDLALIHGPPAFEKEDRMGLADAIKVLHELADEEQRDNDVLSDEVMLAVSEVLRRSSINGTDGRYIAHVEIVLHAGDKTHTEISQLDRPGFEIAVIHPTIMKTFWRAHVQARYSRFPQRLRARHVMSLPFITHVVNRDHRDGCVQQIRAHLADQADAMLPRSQE
ncbi:hypothetical protein FI667_g13555, partial [Globisporangium splendens]